jgi:hypothetical protein
MLAANIPETPRPRPPAKVRRSVSKPKPISTPPPSYAAAFSYTPGGQPRVDALLGSPMPVTFRRVGWGSDNRDGLVLSPATEEDREWANERSREELSELLVKADDLIKERENGMQAYTSCCQSRLADKLTPLSSQN